jgi:hypothetical protein
MVGPADVLKKVTIKNTADQAANDFHIQIVSDHEDLSVFNRNIKATPFAQFLSDLSDDKRTLTITFFGTTVQKEEEMNLAIIFNNKLFNELTVKEAWWSVRAGPNDPISGKKLKDVAIPGFRVVGDPTYTIFNDFDLDLGIRNLRFGLNLPNLTIDELFDSTPILPGMPTLDPFILPKHSSRDIDVPGNLLPGLVLFAQGEMYDPATGESYGTFSQGHQAPPVPEPLSKTLFLTALLFLFVRVAVERHKARAGESREYTRIQ